MLQLKHLKGIIIKSISSRNLNWLNALWINLDNPSERTTADLPAYGG